MYTRLYSTRSGHFHLPLLSVRLLCRPPFRVFTHPIISNNLLQLTPTGSLTSTSSPLLSILRCRPVSSVTQSFWVEELFWSSDVYYVLETPRNSSFVYPLLNVKISQFPISYFTPLPTLRVPTCVPWLIFRQRYQIQIFFQCHLN